MVYTLQPPVSVILSWPEANYVDPYDRGPALFICCILFSIVGMLLVSARIYSRLFLTRAPGSDDILIVFGYAFTVVLSGLVAYANKKYFTGRNIWDVPLSVHSKHRLNIWISEWMYLAAASCIKISILLFYRRLSVSFSKWFYYATYIGIIYNILTWIGFVIALLVICSPTKAYWLSFDYVWIAENKYHCTSEIISLPLSGGLSMIGDLYSTLLPMFMISSTPRSPRQKIGLYILFSLGFFSVACGIIRTYLMFRIIDVEYNFVPSLYYMWIVTLFELYFAIFAASAPALKPFFKKFLTLPVSKAKSSGIQSTTRTTNAKSPGPWNPNNPWSHTSSNKDSVIIDIEKVGIAHGFPEEIHTGTHTTWMELRSSHDQQLPQLVQKRPYSRMVSFPEEREPSIDEIAIAR